MVHLKNASHCEEINEKEGVIAIARRMLEKDKYNKEFIMYLTDLTEEEFIVAVKRATIMDCAKIFYERYTLEFLKEKLNLNEEEVKDLVKYKEKQKNEEKTEQY